VVRTEGKRPLGRQRLEGADNNVMNLRKRGWSGIDWINLAHEKDK
jgi:hypothetical protein